MSVACWLSVPGSDRLSFVLLPSACETATSATVATNHTAMTNTRRRTQNRASPYSTPVMPNPFLADGAGLVPLDRRAVNRGEPGARIRALLHVPRPRDRDPD